MPPVASAAICAKPITMSTASARPTEKRLNGDTNPGARQANTVQKAAMMITSPNCAGTPPKPKRRRADISLMASSVMRLSILLEPPVGQWLQVNEPWRGAAPPPPPPGSRTRGSRRIRRRPGYPHPRSGGATVMIGIARCSAGLKAALRAPASGGFGLDPVRSPGFWACMRSARCAARRPRAAALMRRLEPAGSRSHRARAWC